MKTWKRWDENNYRHAVARRTWNLWTTPGNAPYWLARRMIDAGANMASAIMNRVAGVTK